MMATKIRNAFLAGIRGLALMVVSLTGSVILFTFTIVSVLLIVIGVGLFTTPAALTALRGYASRRRLLAAQWSDVRIPVPYRPLPTDLRGGFVGQVERCVLMLKDPATWRDFLWLLVDMTVGSVSALLPAVLILYPVESLVLAAGLWRVFAAGGDAYWYGPVRVDSQGTALLAVAFGLVIFHAGVRYNPALLRAHFTLTKSLLGPTPEMTLAQRVDHLTETRHDAVDTSAAELRRIERDLHDGAQARLVAMGMNLGTIEALVEKDPAQAKKLLAMARESSAEALSELRDLVRGIHPPVLAERGLGDAVRALALRLPIETQVTVDLPRRADAPVESAAYFAVSEVFTNAVKHSGADRVYADIHHADGMLRISVTDNGRGGAAAGPGSGLSGIERRLGTFDGVLAVSSPTGGPTMVTMEIPCELF
ncbi:sensor domain-containing protein [Streptomyces sp. ISL-96]|uniref:sensor histidine kinase n=1 Tax=Streptomyces sp. ISL-96 TaxID=2819191 RepID=UPI001BEC0309|nr:sensor domain-containing protein [Streptomyces sp. ISL-96]MBT2489397.1 sensor domain-containing protein [Streptomyces sp. ISL-96]